MYQQRQPYNQGQITRPRRSRSNYKPRPSLPSLQFNRCTVFFLNIWLRNDKLLVFPWPLHLS